MHRLHARPARRLAAPTWGMLAVALLLAGQGCARPPGSLAGTTAGGAAGQDPQLERALEAAGPNRPELEAALAGAPATSRADMQALILQMPPGDLSTLRAAYLLENLALANQARALAPWGADLPEAIFRYEVLPYACASEPRAPWRAEFFRTLSPLVRNARSPSEAAQRLNETIWKQYNVRYSPKRLRPDQSPAQSMSLGTASCTGLSIFLCLACRSVAVPSRVVGLEAWPHKPGNHTWVEIYDQGRWRYVGAAEPEHPVGSAWFAKEAGLALRDDPRHSIWAISFRRTGERLPFSWARDVPLEGTNITDQYAPWKPVAAPDR